MKTLRALGLLLCALGLATGQAHAAELVILGRVVHGETGRPVSGIEVRVIGMSAGRPPQELTTRTDRAGRFRVHADPTFRAYAVQALYRGVVYTEGPLRPESGRLTLTIRVYETTRDPRGVYLARRAVLLEPATPGVLEVREVVVLANRTKRTYVGPVRLALLPGAREISVRQGMAPAGVDPTGALVDSLPVTPGFREIVLSYRIPYRTGRIVLALPVTLPVETLDVFAPEPLWIRSAALPGREVRKLQARRVVRIWGSPPTGSTVSLEISGLAAPSRLLPGIGVALLALGVGGVAALPWIRRN